MTRAQEQVRNQRRVTLVSRLFSEVSQQLTARPHGGVEIGTALGEPAARHTSNARGT